MDNIKIRIVNKTKEGCTLDLKGRFGKHTISWEEFNKSFVIEDKVWAVPNEDFRKVQEEAESVLNDAVVYFMGIEASEKSGNMHNALAMMLGLGERIEKLTELLVGVSKAEIAGLIKHRADMFRASIGNSSVHDHGRSRKTDHKKKSLLTYDDGNREATNCLGDIKELQKLKEQMEKEKE